MVVVVVLLNQAEDTLGPEEQGRAFVRGSSWCSMSEVHLGFGMTRGSLFYPPFVDPSSFVPTKACDEVDDEKRKS